MAKDRIKVDEAVAVLGTAVRVKWVRKLLKN